MKLTYREIAALIFLYVVWGSNYLSIRVALSSVPPFLLAAVTTFPPGLLLYLILRFRGMQTPTKSEWINASGIGALLFAGYGLLIFSERWVASGMASVMFATVPLWVLLFARLFGERPRVMEWIGLGIGFVGVILLYVRGNLWVNPGSAITVLVAALIWAGGSFLSRRLHLTSSLMDSAAKMICGGLLLFLVSFGLREKMITTPTLSTWLAMLSLTFLGALIGYSAYMYLLNCIPLPLATSFAYVNPLVAIALGWKFNQEPFTLSVGIATAAILASVAWLAWTEQRLSTQPSHSAANE